MSIIFEFIIIPLLCVIGGIAAIAFFVVFLPIHISDQFILWRRGDLKRQRDVRFSNTVYLCENEDCGRKFFRMYHIFEAYKLGYMTIPGEPEINELAYSQNVRVKWAEKLGICRCPECHSDNITRTKQFAWMDTSPAFPKLDNKGLAERRKHFSNPDDEKQTNLALEAIREKINEIDSIAAYQYNYAIPGREQDDNENAKRVQHIQEQLELLKQTTPYTSSRQTAHELLQMLGVTGIDRFSAQIPEMNVPDENDVELQEALAAVIRAEECARKNTSEKRPRNYLDNDRYQTADEVTATSVGLYFEALQNAQPNA